MSTNSTVLGKPGLGVYITQTAQKLSGNLRGFVVWRKAYNRTFQELNGLTERDLADLGMRRCDLDHIAREAADEMTGRS